MAVALGGFKCRGKAAVLGEERKAVPPVPAILDKGLMDKVIVVDLVRRIAVRVVEVLEVKATLLQMT